MPTVANIIMKKIYNHEYKKTCFHIPGLDESYGYINLY